MSEKISPFEKIFPYLSYRWRYDDGEYSPYAPFTEVQFLSVGNTSDKERYKNGFNVFMVNNAQEIRINSLPIGREDVVAVDILYTESISSTVYILKTIEIKPADRFRSSLNDILIPRRSIGAALPDNQLTRHFDSVPLKAKSQEITANRLMYGNYVHKFNQGISYDGVGEDGFKLNVAATEIDGAAAGTSVKTNRTYEVGVAYIDRYGRQGGLLTQQVQLPGATGSSFKTGFTYNSRIRLAGIIKSKAPSWAVRYRYFVKDTSGPFYNLSAFNTYIEGDPNDPEQTNAYLQFDSKDRNKITEDSFLIPRRSTHFDSDGDVLYELNRLPILSIENEAPDIVKAQVQEKKTASITSFVGNAAKSLVTTQGGNGANPTEDDMEQGDTAIVLMEDQGSFISQQSAINAYITSQDSSATIFDTSIGGGASNQTVDISSYTERLIIKTKRANSVNLSSDYNLVDSIVFMRVGSGNKRNTFKFNLGERVTEDGSVKSGTGLSGAGHGMVEPGGVAYTVFLNKFALTETGANKLKGSFFVKVPRLFADPSPGALIKAIPVGQSKINEEGEITEALVVDFETDAGENSNLDLYWESANTFPISKHGQVNPISWSNCIARIGDRPSRIYQESTMILDKFNSTELAKSIRVNTPDARFAEEHRKAGLIFSGLYNSKTGINQLNQFNLTDGIQKELEPNYGGIQKLFALDTNLLAFTEDKVFRILADKDALFNADDGVNVTATNLVLGQSMVYQGNYGISTHPESFAYFKNNVYFTDAKRGAVMQLTPANGQLFEISSRGMSNFFRDRIGTADKLIGAYDGSKNMYVLSMQGYDQNNPSIGDGALLNETSDITLGYSMRSEGWASRYSFIPESGVTMNNKFYTFKNANAYLHNSNTANRNNFYGIDNDSEIEVIFNDNPTYVSDFLTLNYEGDSDWEASSIIGDQDGTNNITNVRLLDSEESGFLGWFLKEGKYHGAIVGTQPMYIIDPAGTVDSNGFWPLIQDGANTQDVSGTKGFFANVRFKNSATTAKELFAVTAEYYISQT